LWFWCWAALDSRFIGIREAVRRYPDIGVAGSRLNMEFVARHKRYQKEHPEYFRDTSWPLRLAEESARAIKGP
jgi:hypothetical protein